MKKTIATLMAIITIATVSKAQKSGYAQGNKLLNIGIGVNSYYNGGIPIGVSFEKGVSDLVSVGVNFDYLSHTYNSGTSYSYKFSAMYFGIRGSYHFNEILSISDDKLDVYGGLNLGYRSFSWGDTYSYNDGYYGSGIYLGAFVGGKYYFSSKTGAFAEFGAIGSTNARVGVAFKF